MVTDHRDAEAVRLDVALGQLVSSGTLTSAQADAVRAELSAVPAEPARSSWTAVLPEVGGYIGGAFVVSAAIVLAGPRWDDLGYGGQLAALGIPGMLMIGASVTVALSTPGGWAVHPRTGLGARRRLVAVLFVVGIALMAAFAAIIADSEPAVAAATTALFLGVAGYLFCRTMLLHVAAFIAIAWASASWIFWAVPGFQGGPSAPPDGSLPSILVGITFAVIAVAWAALALGGVLDERQLGLFCAGVLFFVGSQMLALGGGRAGSTGAGYLMLAALAAAGLIGYIRTRYVAVLVIGVVALATVVPQAVIDYTNGALGAAGALLLVGLSIVGASVVGMRLRRTGEEPAG